MKKERGLRKGVQRYVAISLALLMVSVGFAGVVPIASAHDPSEENPDPCPPWVPSGMEFDTRDEVVSHLEGLGFQQTLQVAANYNENDFTQPITYEDHGYAYYRNQAIIRETSSGKWTYSTQGPEPNPDITTYPFWWMNPLVWNWVVGYVRWWHEEFCNEAQGTDVAVQVYSPTTATVGESIEIQIYLENGRTTPINNFWVGVDLYEGFYPSGVRVEATKTPLIPIGGSDYGGFDLDAGLFKQGETLPAQVCSSMTSFCYPLTISKAFNHVYHAGQYYWLAQGWEGIPGAPLSNKIGPESVIVLNIEPSQTQITPYLDSPEVEFDPFASIHSFYLKIEAKNGGTISAGNDIEVQLYDTSLRPNNRLLIDDLEADDQLLGSAEKTLNDDIFDKLEDFIKWLGDLSTAWDIYSYLQELEFLAYLSVIGYGLIEVGSAGLTGLSSLGLPIVVINIPLYPFGEEITAFCNPSTGTHQMSCITNDMGLTTMSLSPVNLQLIDPNGFITSKQINQIPGAVYTESDIDGDGDLEDTISISQRINGEYKIFVTSEPGAPPTATFDLVVSFGGVSLTLGKNIEVNDIGNTPYTVSFEPFEFIEQYTIPEADAGSDQTVLEAETAYFDASGSYNGGGEIVSYEWDFDGDGATDATGAQASYTWYDNGLFTVTLIITVVFIIPIYSLNGGVSYFFIYRTYVDTTTVTVLNLDPTASIDCGYMYVDFTLRFAGEKWHNVYWDLYETDEAEEEGGIGDGGQVGHGELLAHLECVRYPGDPDAQSDSVYDIYIDAEKIYYSITTYYPYEDDMPVSGQPHGSNPTWIDMTFEDGSTERIHHNFNEIQSIVRDSDHWVHRHPWPLDFSPWLVTHTWTFNGSTTDQGTDDETFTWDWDDETPFDIAFYTYRRPDPTTDPFPSPYDRDEGSYPVDIIDTQYHAYMMEDDFVPELTITDDDYPAEGEIENDGMAFDSLDVDAIHTREIQLPDGTKLARK